MRIGGVEFPEPLLNALRHGRLVVFAGAGVSMGPPANLPGFRELARQVAEGTGLSIGEFEQEDRFLGRVKESGPDVHQIAAQRLEQNEPQPTELHRSLLRLYPKVEDIRMVTTNFDLLFEEAANGLFSPGPRIFHAPVLPLGERFQGIVHIHGSVNEPEDTVLTSKDFGHAYLTEADGWARRFLVDLFANHTVLFVGYSHSDTIMTYLTPSLLGDSNDTRYALIGDRSDTPARWHSMGIQPITFPQESESDYRGLEKAVSGLANHTRRRILDWQREITNIASAPPPLDEESAGVIEHALSTPELAQFFTGAATSPDWISWLDRRGLMDTLFAGGKLSDQDRMLASWLSRRFALAHGDTLFRTIEDHRFRLNPEFWKLLSWQMQNSIPDSPDVAAMTRWVLFLSGVTPANADDIALLWIAKAAASVGAMDALLRTYEEMTALVNREPPRGGRILDRYHHELETMLTECLKPNLPQIAESLLEITARRLSERHSALTAWRQAESTWDSDSLFRSAIEPHAQDEFNQDIDALIDVARECLEWLADSRAEYARLWSERHANSQAPLLRRLAIHTLTELAGLSADKKIAWLLERCDVNESAAKHEIFRAVRKAYPHASQELREAFIQAVVDFRIPESDDYDSARRSARCQFDWLHWLHESAPDCELTKKTLDSILEHYPEFLPSEHPDLLMWSKTWASVQSSWTVDALLASPAAEILPSLLEYQPTDREKFDGYDRSALLDNAREAAKQNPDWGLDLADNLAASGLWESDLWPGILRAWAETEVDVNHLDRVLSYLSADELHKEHVHHVTDVLVALTQKTSSAGDQSFLLKANQIAVSLQLYAAKTEIPNITSYVGGVPQEVDWLAKAINHPSGRLVQFWLRSIELWRNGQETPPQSLSGEYLSVLNGIMKDSGATGKLGRAVLTGHLHFMLHVDEGWSVDNLMPLFDAEHEDFRPAWDGLLTWRRITPQVADNLRETLLKAVQRTKRESAWRMQHRFLAYYTEMLVWSASGPVDEWITTLLSDSDGEVRRLFAKRIGFILRSLSEEEQREPWNTWLKGYWENRLRGVPRPLDDEEIAQMLEWVINLPGVFTGAVNLAARMRKVPLERLMLLHLIGESGLTDNHPSDFAIFLIQLGQYDTQSWLWHGTKETVDKLLAKGLPPDIDTGLRELLAKNGQWMGS